MGRLCAHVPSVLVVHWRRADSLPNKWLSTPCHPQPHPLHPLAPACPPPAVDKDVLRINVERSEEKKEETEEQGWKWHR